MSGAWLSAHVRIGLRAVSDVGEQKDLSRPSTRAADSGLWRQSDHVNSIRYRVFWRDWRSRNHGMERAWPESASACRHLSRDDDRWHLRGWRTAAADCCGLRADLI